MIIRGVVLDLVLGDPAWFPHPVRGIGWLIEQSEILWRSSNLPLRVAGTLTWITVAGITVLVVRSTPKLNVLWIWSFLAVRSLDRECAAVVRSMSRDKLALIVGRDTGYLSDAEVLRAVLETMSENLSDGVVAPLFYLALGGPPAMAAYKAANTMDSMLGYKNSRYREFGWFAAKADDVANW
ncbi:MAG TPA: CobD/CbiB family cobalamin biosynthesis protein, partial [Bryobacteraceae bacterium]|nr:CobD/CbiB family cobalamin biosynthesis protein [Bryobacteraceae bacterium]